MDSHTEFHIQWIAIQNLQVHSKFHRKQRYGLNAPSSLEISIVTTRAAQLLKIMNLWEKLDFNNLNISIVILEYDLCLNMATCNNSALLVINRNRFTDARL